MNEILLYFSIKYKGSWDEIYKALDRKEVVDKEKVSNIANEYKGDYVTILMDNYPEKFKYIKKPPFVLFYKGKLSNIDKKVTGFIYDTKKSLVEYLNKNEVNGLICNTKDNIENKQIVVLNRSIKEQQEQNLYISEVPFEVEKRLNNWHRLFEGVSDELICLKVKKTNSNKKLTKLFLYYSKKIKCLDIGDESDFLNKELIKNGAQIV